MNLWLPEPLGQVRHTELNFEFVVSVCKIAASDRKKEITEVIPAKNLLEATSLLNKKLLRKGLKKLNEPTVTAWKESALGHKIPVDLDGFEKKIEAFGEQRRKLEDHFEALRSEDQILVILDRQRLLEEVAERKEITRKHIDRRKNNILKEVSKKFGVRLTRK